MNDQLTAGLDALEAEVLAGHNGLSLIEDVVEFRRQLDRFEAQWLRRIAAAQRIEAFRASGVLSMAGVLRTQCRIAPGRAAEVLRTACQLGHLPATATALAAGDIGYRHAQVLARAVTPDRRRAVDAAGLDLAEQERILVDAARALDPVGLRRLTEHWAHALDPAGVLDDESAAHERRRLHVSRTVDGLTVLDGLLDAEGGATVIAALDSLTWPPAHGDFRSPAQRRADALVDLVRAASGSSEPHAVPDRPRVTVLVELATLRRQPGARAAEFGPGETISGESARRLACDASITRVLISGRSQPLDVGRSTRVVSTALRTALTVRDGGCAFPGCERPPAHCDAHHVTHWADGGATSLDNLVLVCRLHHRLTHEGGWEVRSSAGDRPQSSSDKRGNDVPTPFVATVDPRLVGASPAPT